MFDNLFKTFYARLRTPGPEIVNEGRMTDASFVACLRQRNKREESRAIKDGEGGELRQDNTP